MSDITKCSGEGCPRKSSCWRYIAEADSYQSWFTEVPLDEHGDCGYYWECKDVEEILIRR